jgi:homoserine acetyltransferase
MHNYYSEENHGPHEIFDLGNFELENKLTLPNAKIAYKTHGTLNKAKDNAILFPHMWSGTPKSMEAFIGPGRPLDPNKYFIILPGQFCNGFSSSPSNTGAPYNAGAFPNINIGDDVRAQHKLITERYGIESLELVLGWSMGAQQTYEWAVRFPDMVKRALPFAGFARATPHNYLFVRAHEDMLKSPPMTTDFIVRVKCRQAFAAMHSCGPSWAFASNSTRTRYGGNSGSRRSTTSCIASGKPISCRWTRTISFGWDGSGAMAMSAKIQTVI